MLAIACIVFMSLTLYSCKGPDDSDIQKDVNEKLSSMPSVSATVADGVVTLAGEVPNTEDKATAEAEAKSVKGVKSVVNNCTIAADSMANEPVTMGTDDALTTGVKDAIKDFDGINAAVNNGVITLTGTIKRDRLPNLMQALNTLNPKKIENQLTIQ